MKIVIAVFLICIAGSLWAQAPPTPVITSISPDRAAVGSPNVTVTITGSGFIPASAVSIGSTVETTFVSSSTLTAIFNPARSTSPAILQVRVTNTANGQTLQSGALPFYLYPASGP